MVTLSKLYTALALAYAYGQWLTIRWVRKLLNWQHPLGWSQEEVRMAVSRPSRPRPIAAAQRTLRFCIDHSSLMHARLTSVALRMFMAAQICNSRLLDVF